MAIKKLNTPDDASLANLTVCGESPFSVFEHKLGVLPDETECEASILAFSCDVRVIDEAKEAAKEFGRVEVKSGDKTFFTLMTECREGETSITVHGIRDRFSLYEAVEKERMSVLTELVEKGVLFETFDGCVISPFCEIAEGTLIRPNTRITGKTKIGKNCVIGPCSMIDESEIGDDCIVNATEVCSSVFENDVRIGPFSRVRPGSLLKSGVRVGDFVEIKNSVVGRDTHAAHLTYIGDSDVGERVNFGCGTVTSNYDGKNKYRTVIGNDVFVGCNTNLVAPVSVGDGAFIAAGSTIVSDVPDKSLAIARERQTVKEGWAEERRKKGLLK